MYAKKKHYNPFVITGYHSAYIAGGGGGGPFLCDPKRSSHPPSGDRVQKMPIHTWPVLRAWAAVTESGHSCKRLVYPFGAWAQIGPAQGQAGFYLSTVTDKYRLVGGGGGRYIDVLPVC